jgi:DNA-binding LacI/PurR family transcriptional regulator
MKYASQAFGGSALDRIASELDRGGAIPLYKQIHRCVRRAIEAGQLPPGETVPPQRTLCRRLGVSEVTLRRALQALAAEGLVSARAGGGTVIAAKGDRRHEDHSSARLHRPVTHGPATLGIAMADVTDGYPFLEPFLEGLRGDDARVSLRLFETPRPGIATRQDFEATLTGLDGLIMMSPVHTPLLAACHTRRLPVVLFFSDIADGRSHCVVADYRRGVLQAVHHLYGCGRRRIALVTADRDRFSTGQLLDAYRDAIDIHALTPDPDLVLHTPYTQRAGYEATRRLLALPEPPDAIVFASDRQADGGLAAREEVSPGRGAELDIVGAGEPAARDARLHPMPLIDLRLREAGEASLRLLTSPSKAKGPKRVSLPSRLCNLGAAATASDLGEHAKAEVSRR